MMYVWANQSVLKAFEHRAAEDQRQKRQPCGHSTSDLEKYSRKLRDMFLLFTAQYGITNHLVILYDMITPSP